MRSGLICKGTAEKGSETPSISEESKVAKSKGFASFGTDELMKMAEQRSKCVDHMS